MALLLPMDVPTPNIKGACHQLNGSFVSSYRSMLSVPRYSMGLKLTTRDPENFGLLILKVADGTAGSLLVFFEHWLMSFRSPCDARY